MIATSMPDEDKIEPDDATCNRKIRFGRAFPFEVWNGAKGADSWRSFAGQRKSSGEVTRSARFHFCGYHLIVSRGLWSSKTTRFSSIL